MTSSATNNHNTGMVVNGGLKVYTDECGRLLLGGGNLQRTLLDLINSI